MSNKGPSVGVLRKAWDAVMNVMLQKEVVGKDKMGNTYYRYFETQRDIKIERREVKWNTVYVMYDPNDIPSEWRMWLRKLRDDPPTEAEMAQAETKAQTLKARVAALDEQERLRRMRMESMGVHAHQASQQPDLSRVLQQMGHSDETPQKGASAGKPAQAPSQPEAGPSGSGDTFTPGVWKP